MAIRICEFLRLPEIQGVSRILAHWACYKVRGQPGPGAGQPPGDTWGHAWLAPQVQQKDKSDEEVAQAINQKLGDTAGISYSDIATRAYDCGRTELAIKVGTLLAIKVAQGDLSWPSGWAFSWLSGWALSWPLNWALRWPSR